MRNKKEEFSQVLNVFFLAISVLGHYLAYPDPEDEECRVSSVTCLKFLTSVAKVSTLKNVLNIIMLLRKYKKSSNIITLLTKFLVISTLGKNSVSRPKHLGTSFTSHLRNFSTKNDRQRFVRQQIARTLRRMCLRLCFTCSSRISKALLRIRQA